MKWRQLFREYRNILPNDLEQVRIKGIRLRKRRTMLKKNECG
ncbi:MULTISPECIES: hypothetical protein [Bacillaceae]|nr:MULTISPECIES: hypothetical protein [Bacillaceae]